MAINRRVPPASSTSAFATGWAQRRHSTLGTLSPQSLPAPLPSADAWPVFAVGVGDLLKAMPLDEAAVLMHWRFIVTEPVGAVAADVSVAELESRDGSQRVERWNHGRFNEALTATAKRLAVSEEAAGGDYELRALVVPALSVLAVWLWDDSTRASLVVPLSPTDTRLVADRAYSAEEFVVALAPSAMARLAQPERK